MRKFEENYAVKLIELCRQTICLISYAKYLDYSSICIIFAITIAEAS